MSKLFNPQSFLTAIKQVCGDAHVGIICGIFFWPSCWPSCFTVTGVETCDTCHLRGIFLAGQAGNPSVYDKTGQFARRSAGI